MIGPRPRLVVRLDGTEHAFPATAPVEIGRDPAATLPVTHPRVSKRHLRASWIEGTWLVEDLGSRNGTHVDGERIERLPMTRPIRLVLGPVDDGLALDLRVEGPAQSEPPASPRRSSPSDRPVRPRAPVADPGGTLAPGMRSSLHHPQGSRIRIGRAADNDVVLPDLEVSRHHAELRRLPDGDHELVDVGSKRGTFLNGQRVDRAHARDGDLIGIGHVVLRLREGVLEEFVDAGDVTLDALSLTVVTPRGDTILADVSLSLPPRSFAAVLGPSGSGKSTLMRALAAFRPADQGTVLYNGRDLYASLGELRNRLGYVPQDDILHEQLTVRQALRFAADLRFPSDTSATERAGRVDEVMAELGIGRRSELPVSQLSGGQRKRVNVAMELLTRPTLLFLDEPTSGLDPGFERSVMHLLRQLADSGRTIVVITHSISSLDLTDRVVFLAPGGQLAFLGQPAEVLTFFQRTNYADVFVDLEAQQQDWPAAFAVSPLHQRYVAAPLERRAQRSDSKAEPAASRPPRPERQLGTLVRRYATVLRADRRFLLALLGTAPLLGLLMLAVVPPDALGPPSLATAGEAMSLLLVLVLTATAYGAIDGVREIVKERAILRREVAVGLSPGAYLWSKVLILGAIVCTQVVALTLVALARQSPPAGMVFASGHLELIAVLALTGLSGMALGLLVSAAVGSADRAVVLLMLLLVPQLILSGALPLPSVPGLDHASYAMPMRWAVAAAAASAGLQSSAIEVFAEHDPSATCDDVGDLRRELNRELEAIDPRLRDGLTATGLVSTVDQLCDPLWAPTRPRFLANVGVLIGLTLVALFVAQTLVRQVGRTP